MVACGKCGAENESDSKQCKSCGSTLEPAPSGASAPTPPPGTFVREVSDIGARIGKDVGRAGEKFGKEMEKRGTEFGAWWDKSLGIFSPIIVALFAIIGFLVAILVIRVIAEVSDRPAFWSDLLDFLETYWWLFFILAFYGALQSYLMRRYRPVFIWINPLVTGVGCVVWLWILAQVLHMAEVDRGHTNLGDLGDFIEEVLLIIFVLVVVGGYLLAFIRSASPANWDKKKPV